MFTNFQTDPNLIGEVSSMLNHLQWTVLKKDTILSYTEKNHRYLYILISGKVHLFNAKKEADLDHERNLLNDINNLENLYNEGEDVIQEIGIKTNELR